MNKYILGHFLRKELCYIDKYDVWVYYIGHSSLIRLASLSVRASGHSEKLFKYV